MWFKEVKIEPGSTWMLFACEKTQQSLSWLAVKGTEICSTLFNSSFHHIPCKRSCGSSITGSVRDQVGQVFEQSDLVVEVLAHRGGWTRWSLKVRSDPNHSLILWKPFHTDPLHFHWLKFPWHYCALRYHSRHFVQQGGQHRNRKCPSPRTERLLCQGLESNIKPNLVTSRISSCCESSVEKICWWTSLNVF